MIVWHEGLQMQVTIILSTLYLTSIGVDGRSLKGTKILNVFCFCFCFFFSSQRVCCVKRRNCLIDNLHFHIFTITNISIIITIIMFLQVTTCI